MVKGERMDFLLLFFLLLCVAVSHIYLFRSVHWTQMEIGFICMISFMNKVTEWILLLILGTIKVTGLEI